MRLKQKIQNSREYKDLRQQVLAEAEYKCEKCGDTERLEIHHIKPLREIVEENNITELYQAYLIEKIWDTNNYQALCHTCHLETDSYGKNTAKAGSK
jgi:5-methylcytosine-specific restriction endonuclease McrA